MVRVFAKAEGKDVNNYPGLIILITTIINLSPLIVTIIQQLFIIYFTLLQTKYERS